MCNNLNGNNFLANQQQKPFPAKPQTSNNANLLNDQTSLNALFQNDQNNSRTSPPSNSTGTNVNNMPAYHPGTSQPQTTTNSFQPMPDFNSLPLPLATQWIANMNNSLINMNAQTGSNNNLNNRQFMNINQSLTSLLPAFLSNTQPLVNNSLSGKIAGQGPISPGVFSFPQMELLNQQYQANQLNNLQFQTQFIDSLKNNNVSVLILLICFSNFEAFKTFYLYLQI